MSDDFDARLRREAQAWLTAHTHDSQLPLTSDEPLDFEIDGRPFKLMDRQRGIRKPRELAAALSIRTVYTVEGGVRPYEDAVGPDGLLRDKWRGDDPNHAENRALREAMRRRLVDQETPVTEHLRRYLRRETWQRLHQPVFRATVLRAYATRCAVCALRHHQLLDAAHIVADREEAGVAAVRNGLSLCKIHHAAYDCHVLGIRPDLVVEIRADLLAEVDGPMHGIEGRRGQPLMALPTVRAERPDPDLLDRRYTRFRAAG